MFCINCGVENPPKAKYCFKCGTAIMTNAPVPVTADTPLLAVPPQVTSDASVAAQPAKIESPVPTPAPRTAVVSMPAPAAPVTATTAPQPKPKPKKENALWPKVDTLPGAKSALRLGGGVCFFLAALAIVVGLITVGAGSPAGIGALIEALIYGLAGWRIFRLSRAWALLALMLYLSDVVLAIANGHAGATLGAVFFVSIVGLINGIRGTFAYRRLVTASGPQPQRTAA